MNGEFNWDDYINGQAEVAKADVLERVIAHVLSLDEGDLRRKGLEAIHRASKTICYTLTALHLMAKYAPSMHQV